MNPAMLPPGQWRHVDARVWARWWPWLLGDDRPDPAAVVGMLAGDSYRPDTFTVAERFDHPLWLDEGERDGHTWLRRLVARRVAAFGDLPAGATAHVCDQARRLLELPHHDRATVAESVYNQEAPYLVDRLCAWCLATNPHQPPTNGTDRRARARGRRMVADLFNRHGAELADLDGPALLAVAVAAGLVGLDAKPSPPPPATIPLAGWTPGPATTTVWKQITGHARRTPAADDTHTLLTAAGTGRVRLAWFVDDLIETGFDLLTIQHLTAVNPRLEVLIVAKNGSYDYDATHHDITRFLDLPGLAPLAETMATGRVTLATRGPQMATINLTRLHPHILGWLATADLVFCKGGRVHEMLTGNLARPMITGYVLLRGFTASQAGYPPEHAPVLIFATEAGEWPWWGFHGRATPRQLPAGHTAACCHSTIAEHRHRTTTGDPGWLAGELARLLDLWPTVRGRYHHAALQELRLTATRLAPHAATLPTTTRKLLTTVDTLQ